MQTAICVVVATSISYCIFIVMQELVRRFVQPESIEIRPSVKIDSLVLKIMLPLARHLRVKFSKMIPDRIIFVVEEKIRFAGLENEMFVEEFISSSILAGFAGFMFFSLMGGSFLAGVCGTVLCCAWPSLWLVNLVDEKRKVVRSEIVSTLELIAISVSAGVDVTQAIMQVSEKKHERAIGQLLNVYVEKINEGLARNEALLAMLRYCDEKNFVSVVRSLVQSDRLGVGISATLKKTAAKVRDQMYADARCAATSASQKALIPLVFCIMPATFLVVFGPIFVRLYYGGVAGLLGI